MIKIVNKIDLVEQIYNTSPNITHKFFVGFNGNLALLYFTKLIVKLLQERRRTFWAKTMQLNDIVNILPTKLQTPFHDESRHCGFCSNINLTHATTNGGYFWSLQLLWQNGVNHSKLCIELAKEMAKHAWVMKSSYDLLPIDIVENDEMNIMEGDEKIAN